MEIIYSEGLKYSTICPECKNEILFKINTDNFNISGKCKKGHIFTKSFEDFKDCCLSSKFYYYIKCNRCYSLIDDQINNFICEKCNLIFCNNCINYHLKEKNQSIKKIYINYNKICQLHKEKYSLFCDKCKKNICSKCANEHNNHNIKSYLEVIPTKKEIESIGEIYKNFNEKIDNIFIRINSYKNEIQERFVIFNNYLKFLKLTINKILIKNFNYLHFDYYNYKNFKYLSNYLNTEEILQNDNFLKYLSFGKFSDKEKQENKEDITESNSITLDSKINIKDDKKIDYYRKLIYLKDNIFFQYSSDTIKLFEFKYKSFNHILTYSFNTPGRVDSIKHAKYSNNIFINYKNKKNIKIIEYDLDNKTMSLIKDQIKKAKLPSDTLFINFIDDKEGNIITSDENDLILWSKYKKKYKEKKKISGKFDTLTHISDMMFCGKSLGCLIFFFEFENFKVINKMYIRNDFEILGSINNNIFILTENFNNLLIIDLKYFEIVQIMNINKFNILKIQKNYLISSSRKDNLIKIQKHFFNPKERQFENREISEVEIENNYSITTTNNDYFIIKDHEKLFVFNI